MKKTIRKITASITAAVLCALPLANTLSASAVANANARYTYRTVFAVQSAKNIDLLVAGVACKSANTSAPAVNKLTSGTITGSGGGAPGLYAGGANFYPTNHNVTGALISFHTYCNSPSDYKEVSITNFAYAPNGNAISNAVKALPTFLVGDINADSKVNEADYQILYRAVEDNTVSTSRYKVNYFARTRVTLGGTTRSYNTYKLDINNDGYLSDADVEMFDNYLNGNLTKFAK